MSNELDKSPLPSFKINLDGVNKHESFIEMNGERMQTVTRFAVSIDAEHHLPVVTMTLLARNIEGTISGAEYIAERPILFRRPDGSSEKVSPHPEKAE